jgi:parallel beta helix pectate lyase-like protein
VRNGATIGGVGGLEAGVGGHVRVETSSATVADNSVHGIWVYGGGTAFVDGGATIASNANNGIHVQDGGAVLVQGTSIISGNGGPGIFSESGDVRIGDFDGPATIQNNGNNGVLLWTNSVAKFNNVSNQIINNGGWGILCSGAPSNPLIYGAVGTVSGNAAGQISCNVAPEAATRQAGGTRAMVGAATHQ